ncbi:MAG: hypothetical protein FJZ58_01635 [Chlamydiae bacterium]|nr:hypothetical protein [Chlamydiota bacterium]
MKCWMMIGVCSMLCCSLQADEDTDSTADIDAEDVEGQVKQKKLAPLEKKEQELDAIEEGDLQQDIEDEAKDEFDTDVDSDKQNLEEEAITHPVEVYEIEQDKEDN